MLHFLFECIKCSSSVSLEKIKLIAIASSVFQVPHFLRLFMISFKYCLTLLRYSSIDSSSGFWSNLGQLKKFEKFYSN